MDHDDELELELEYGLELEYEHEHEHEGDKYLLKNSPRFLTCSLVRLSSASFIYLFMYVRF